MRTILGVVIVLSLVLMVIPGLGVARQALRIKRRLPALKDRQLFLALVNAEAKMLHLHRSATMLNAQFASIKAALDQVRESISTIRTLGMGEQLARLRREAGSLFGALR